MNRRNFLALTLGVATTALIEGCGGGGNKGGATGEGFGRGVVAGTIYLDASGAIVLGEAGTPPAGFTPARGAKLEIVNESKGTSTSDSGRFELADVKAGLRVLRVQAGSTTHEFPLTVIHGATISLAPTPVSREQAVAAVRAAVEVPTGALIVATQQPVPAGVVLNSGDGDGTGVTLSSAQWVVFVDPTPGLLFGHPVKIVCVDTETAVLQVHEREFWPTFNGSHYYLEAASAPSFADTVQAGRVQPRPDRANIVPASRAKARATRAESTAKLEAVTVVGFTDLSFENDAKDIAGIFGRGGFPAGTPVALKPPTASHRDVVFSWEQACDRATSEDTVFFYLAGHGSKNGYALLATGGTITSDTPEELKESGSFFAYDHLAPQDLTPSLLRCLACNVVLMIDTAYAGVWTDFFSTWTSPRKQMNLTVLAGCDAQHSGVIDVADSYYTTQFIKHFQSPSADNSKLSVNLKYAHGQNEVVYLANPDKKISTQNPQMHQRTMASSVECGVSFMPESLTVNPKKQTPTRINVLLDGETPQANAYTYEFTCTAKEGKLIGGSSTKVVKDIAEIEYQANSTAKIGNADTISVRVKTKEDAPRLVGEATVQVKIGGEEKVVPVSSSFIIFDDPGADQLLGKGKTVLVWGFTFPITKDAVSYRVELVGAPGREPRSVAKVLTENLGPSGSFSDIWSSSSKLAPMPYEITAGADNYGFRGGFFHIGETIFAPMGFTRYGKDEFYATRADAEKSLRENWYAASERRLLVDASVIV